MLFIVRLAAIIIFINILYMFNANAGCKRIISLAPSITETLFYMGLGNNVVGVTRYARWPKKVSTIPKIGGYYDVNFESLINLKPSVVVMTYRQNRLASQIKKLHIKTLIVHHNSIYNIINSINTIGRYCGNYKKSSIMSGKLKKEIYNIKQKYKNYPHRKILICFGSPGTSTIIVAGNKSIYGDIIKIIGAKNIYQGNLSWANMSLSSIIKLNPYAIFILGEKKRDTKSITNWKKLPIKASLHNRIYTLSKNIYITPSPRIIDVIKNIAFLLYKN